MVRAVSSVNQSYFIPGNPAKKAFELENLFNYANKDKVSYSDFQEEIKSYYGERLAAELETEYGSYAAPFITIEEVKQRIVSIAALVKKEDLETLFDEITAGSKKRKCLEVLTFDEETEIRNSLWFDDLQDQQIEILMSVFRYFPNERYEMQAVGSLFYPLKQFPRVPSKSKIFYKHLTMVRAFERADHFIQNSKRKNFAFWQKLAASEHLSREIAYGIPLNDDLKKHINLLKQKKLLTPSELQTAIEELIKKEVVGTIFSSIDAEGKKVFFEIKSSVFERGLVAFFCAPLTPGQWQTNGSSDAPYPIKAIFRGTWCVESMKRDFTEGIEVGQNSFFGLSPSIIERLEESISEEAENVWIDACGHSLGGSDASRLAVTLAEIRSQRQRELGQSYESKLDSIRGINLTTWNTPGLLKSTCQRYNDNLDEIKRNPILPLECNHTHVKVGEDVFQNFGRTLPGWQDPKLLKVPQKDIRNRRTRLVQFDFEKMGAVIGTTWFAHRLPCLSVEARKTKVRIYRGNINQRLGPKGFWGWIKLIATAIIRRTKRIPSAVCNICKRIFVKRKVEDFSEIYKALAIRKIFNQPSASAPLLHS